MLVDTHCHLDFSDFDADRDEVIKRARAQGLEFMVNIGSSLEGSRRSVELAHKYDCVYSTVGIHPHDADEIAEGIVGTLKELARQDKVVAIGEIGLDYFKNYSKAENQRKLFKSLSMLAKELELPMVLHVREAQDDVLEVIRPLLPHKIVVHCFSGDEAFLTTCLDLGFFISFTCNITYKKAHSLRDLVKKAPLERMFLETDAPYLSAEGMRGKRNEPAYVKYVAEEVSRIKGISYEEVCRFTTQNAKDFFNLK